MDRWVELFRSVGRAVLELVGAEFRGLFGDLWDSGRSFLRAVGYLLLAGALAFWMVGVLTVSAIAALTRFLPLWGAALVVAGVLLVGVMTVGLAGLGRLREIELPARTIRRHVDDHLHWWQEEVFEEETAPARDE